MEICVIMFEVDREQSQAVANSAEGKDIEG